MRTVCKTNIRKALRKSYDSNRYEDVNDEWMAEMEYYVGWSVGPRAVLWNHETGEQIHTGVLVGCTSMTDMLTFATDLLMRDYERKAA